MSTIIIICLSIVVVVCLAWVYMWRKQQRYFQTAVGYLLEHPKLDLTIHVFTGLGSGWLISPLMPKKAALILGGIFIVVTVVMHYLIPSAKLPKNLKSIGMHLGLPVGIGIAWLSCPWMPKIHTLILGTISFVVAETIHYVYPNSVVKK